MTRWRKILFITVLVGLMLGIPLVLSLWGLWHQGAFAGWGEVIRPVMTGPCAPQEALRASMG